MRKANYWTTLVIAGLSITAQMGCADTRPSRFYLLSALSPTQSAREEQGVSIGIGPIAFPTYLDRPQIVTRGGQNRIYFGEFDRWAEPLEENFARVLAKNLGELMATDNVFQHPWKRSAGIDFLVLVTVNRFDATVGILYPKIKYAKLLMMPWLNGIKKMLKQSTLNKV